MDLHHTQIKEKENERGNIFREEFDGSLLDSLLIVKKKKHKLSVSVTKLELFHFKLCLADERGERKGQKVG